MVGMGRGERKGDSVKWCLVVACGVVVLCSAASYALFFIFFFYTISFFLFSFPWFSIQFAYACIYISIFYYPTSLLHS